MIKQMTAEELSIRVALRALVDEYAWRTDRYDYDGYAELFTPDGEGSAVNPGESEPFFRASGTEEIRGVVHGNDQFARTFHAVENHRVVIEGDSVSGVAYCTAHHLIERNGSAETLVMLIRYNDVYALTREGWKFASRRMEMAWLEYFEADSRPYPFKNVTADWMEA